MKNLALVLCMGTTILAGCSGQQNASQDTPPLPNDIVEASKICYAAAVAAPSKSEKPVTARDLLGPVLYFQTVGTTAKSKGAPSLADYGAFMTDAELKLYSDKVKGVDYLPQCYKSYPLAQSGNHITLPEGPDRNALCLYVGQWAPSVLDGADIHDDQITKSAKSLVKNISEKTNLADEIVEKYHLKSKVDNDKLMSKFISNSTKYGNMYDIIQKCSGQG